MKRFARSPWFFAGLAAFFFLPFLGAVHLFDWDEINFAELAREMVVRNNFLETTMYFDVFTEKPPLFFWLQAAAMQVVGVGDYAARLPNALFGILTLPILFLLGKRLFSASFGYYWALAWLGSILPHLYFKSGIIDPVFNFFIFLSLYFFIRYSWKKTQITTIHTTKSTLLFLTLAGVSAGLAILAKGPAALLILGLVLAVYWVLNRFAMFFKIRHALYFLAITLAVPLLWFGANYVANGPKFIVEFTIRQWQLFSTPDAGHGGFMGYHFVVLLLGCFPASIFALQTMFKRELSTGPSHQRDFKRWMLILFWVVLILFSLVKSKIVHYSSLAYFPITFLAAYSLQHIVVGKWRFTMLMKIGLGIIGGLAGLLTLALPFLGKNIEHLKPLFAKDPFAQENIQAVISWNYTDALVGVLLFVAVGFALFAIKKSLYFRFNVLFYGTAFWVMFTLWAYLGNIERISQNAHITFWEDKQGEDCYVATHNFKSYAHLYYTRVKPQESEKYLDRNWLYFGEIDKPLYVSCKVNTRQDFEEKVPDAQFLYARNGFYFYVRKPKP